MSTESGVPISMVFYRSGTTFETARVLIIVIGIGASKYLRKFVKVTSIGFGSRTIDDTVVPVVFLVDRTEYPLQPFVQIETTVQAPVAAEHTI